MKNKELTKPYYASFYQNNRMPFCMALLFYCIMSLDGPMVSWILGGITDAAAQMSMQEMIRIIRITLVFFPALFLTATLSYRFKSVYVKKGILQYKNLAFRNMSEKRVSAFSSRNTGGYLSALTNDIAQIEEDYLSKSVNLVYMSLQFLIALGMMLYYSRLLTLAVIVMAILPALVSVLMGKELTKRTTLVSEQNESFTARLKDLLSGFSVIKSFKAETQTCELFSTENETLEETKKKRRWWDALLSACSNMAGFLTQFVVMFLGVYLTITGQITFGKVMIFINLMGSSILAPMQMIPEMLAKRNAAKALVSKCAGMMAPEEKHENLLPVSARLKDAIALQNVSFGYEEGKPVLKGVHLRFEAGKSYAIVGASGSGKSTLLSLLMGIYDAYDGSLLVDGKEMKEIDHDSLYDLVSLIDQNVFLFDDTIRNNLTMFADFDDEKVQDAVQKSALLDMIRARGEDYLCGEGGSNLSGGEKQRIAIARALLRETKVLLIDEATSALDAETAAHINETIASLEGYTRIVITHRLDEAQLSRFDEIIMLKNGAVAEQGDYDTLRSRKGPFYALCALSA